MNNTVLLNAELNFAGFCLFNGIGNIRRNRPELRIRHQAFRSQNAGNASGQPHHIRGSDAAVKFDFARQNGVNQILGTDDIGTGSFCLIGFFALCHNRNADGLAVSVRQTAYAANHLVGIFRVNAEVDCQINRFVKFRACIGLNQRNRFLQRVALVLVYVLIGVY